jgi:hypothetical protein
MIPKDYHLYNKQNMTGSLKILNGLPEQGFDEFQKEGIGLRLSGGGFHAMLLHTEVLRRPDRRGLLLK